MCMCDHYEPITSIDTPNSKQNYNLPRDPPSLRPAAQIHEGRSRFVLELSKSTMVAGSPPWPPASRKHRVDIFFLLAIYRLSL